MRNGIKPTRCLFEAAGLCLALVAGAPGSPSAQPATPAAVGRILAQAGPPSTLPSLGARLDTLADMQTKSLDPARAWTQANPKWRSVFDRVRSDITSDLFPLLAAQRADAPKAELAYESAIASNLQAQDANAILAYFASPQGAQYLAFQRRINPLVVAGMTFSGTPPPARPVDRVEIQRLMTLVMLSHTFQLAKAYVGSDPSGGDSLGFMIAFAVTRYAHELESLERDCQADLSGFKGFNDSPAARHFFAAVGEASQSMAKRQTPLTTALPAILAKREPEWRALYQATRAK